MFDPTRYGPQFANLLLPLRLNALGPGRPNPDAQVALENLSPAKAFAPHPVRDPAMAELCRAALWLYHDDLEESHRISQTIANASGCYWHALMHRREGDFWNSKYWFRQVGEHPMFAPLAAAAADIAAGEAPDPELEFLMRAGRWDPFQFVDLCQACTRGRSDHEPLCRRIQQQEWQLLFDHCFQRAIGASGH